MDLLAAFIIAIALTRGIKTGAAKVAGNARAAKARVGKAARGGGVARGAYRATRAAASGTAGLGSGVLASAAAGWREGKTRGEDRRTSRREANAARQHRAGLQEPDRQRTSDATDPMWQRGRLHGRRGHTDPAARKIPAYQRGQTQGKRDNTIRGLNDQRRREAGRLDGIRNAKPHSNDPVYQAGWREGQETLADAPGATRPAATPQQAPTAPAGPAGPAATNGKEGGGNTMPAQTQSTGGALPKGVTPQVITLDMAIRFTAHLVVKAGEDMQASQQMAKWAAAEVERRQAAVVADTQRLKDLNVFVAHLTLLGFGEAVTGRVAGVLESTTQRIQTSRAQLQAATLWHTASLKAAAGAERERGQAWALARALASHRRIEEAAASAEGGMAHRQAYGGAASSSRQR